jgi:AcrR family transcriptional regulator
VKSGSPLLAEVLDADVDGTDAMTERILDACYAELLTFGVRRLSVEDVARRAGTARVTIYRRFANKPALVRAVILREGRRLLAEVDAAVDGVPAGAEQVSEGFVAVLRLLRGHPLVQRMLRTEPDLALPFVTTHAAPVIASAREYLALCLKRAARNGGFKVREPREVAELLVRLTLSFILTPESCIRLETDAEARAFVRRHLLPALGAAPGSLPG